MIPISSEVWSYHALAVSETTYCGLQAAVFAVSSLPVLSSALHKMRFRHSIALRRKQALMPQKLTFQELIHFEELNKKWAAPPRKGYLLGTGKVQPTDPVNVGTSTMPILLPAFSARLEPLPAKKRALLRVWWLPKAASPLRSSSSPL